MIYQRINGQRSAKEENRLADTVAYMDGVNGSFDDQTWLASASMERRIARIIGASPISSGQMRQYEYRFLNCVEDGSRTDSPDGAMGGADSYYAYEASNNLFVPIDGSVIVELRPGDGGPWWEFDYDSRLIVARITGVSANGFAHAWTEQMPDPVHPLLDGANWVTLPGGRSGTTTDNPAFERNYAVNIPNDTIVYLHRAYCSGSARVVVSPERAGDGDAVSSQQSVYVTDAIGGTFTLTFDETTDGSNPQTTAAIAYNANAATIKTRLEALSNVTTVTVTGSGTHGSPFIITFDDDFDSHLMLVANASSLLNDQWWVFDWPQNIQDLNVENLTVTDTFNATTGTIITFTDVTFNIIDGSVVNVLNSTFNFDTSIVNITNNSYFAIGGDTTIIIGDDINWGKPKVVPIATNACLTKKTFQVVLDTQTEIPDATWVDLITTTFDVEKTTQFVVIGVIGFDCGSGGVAGDNFHAALYVDGAAETTLIKFRPQHASEYQQPSQVWKLNLTAGSHTVVLKAKRYDGTGTTEATIDTTLTFHADQILTVEHSSYALPNGTFLVSQACTDSPTTCCATTASDPPGSGDYIQTECCERPICETLTVDFDNCGGTGTIVWDSVNAWWSGTVEFTSGASLEFFLRCNAGDWEAMTTGCNTTGLPGAEWVLMTPVDCDPTLILTSGVFLNSACCDGVPTNIIATVTEDADCVGSGGSSCCGGETGMAATLYAYVTGFDEACPDALADLHNLEFTGGGGGSWAYSAGTLVCTEFNMTFTLACTTLEGETMAQWVMGISAGDDVWRAVSADAVCDHPTYGGFYATFSGFTDTITGDPAPYPISMIVRETAW